MEFLDDVRIFYGIEREKLIASGLSRHALGNLERNLPESNDRKEDLRREKKDGKKVDGKGQFLHLLIPLKSLLGGQRGSSLEVSAKGASRWDRTGRKRGNQSESVCFIEGTYINYQSRANWPLKRRFQGNEDPFLP